MIAYMIVFFFFNDTATTEIYTLSLHDALPIWGCGSRDARCAQRVPAGSSPGDPASLAAAGLTTDGGTSWRSDRKSTRLNSSHANISYAVFCLKKKKTIELHLAFISSIYLSSTR